MYLAPFAKGTDVIADSSATAANDTNGATSKSILREGHKLPRGFPA
jgi:hypothetical protein